MAIADLVTKFRSIVANYQPIVSLFEDSSTGLPTNSKATGNAAWTLEQGQIGGERNSSSSTNNWDAVHEESNYTLFAPGGTSETVVSAVPVFVYGFLGKTGTGTLTLRDSSTASATTSPFPAFTLAVAGMVTFPAAIRFENGLTAQLGTGTDAVAIFTRPIG